MIFAQKTLAFKVLIVLDRVLNVLTGGSFQECLSSRAYFMAETSKSINLWQNTQTSINWLFRDENHCKNSFLWEASLKEEWLAKYKDLL